MLNYDSTGIQQKRREIEVGTKEERLETQRGEGEGGYANQARPVFIYCLQCPISGLIRYIGKSVDPQARYTQHLACRRRDYRANWIRSLRSKGLRPVLDILEQVPGDCDEDWQLAEVFWIAYLKFLGMPLCNVSSGGYGGTSTNEVAREKIRAAMTGREISTSHRESLSKSLKGRKLPGQLLGCRKGSVRTPEERAAMSRGRKGKGTGPRPAEWREAIGAGQKGKVLSEEHKEKLRNRVVSEETRLKMSTAAKKRGIPPEQRAKIVASLTGRKGKPMPDELKSKLIACHLGKPVSEETKAKISAGVRKNRWGQV
jgi:plasmid stability protein